ncbi:MAG: S8 family serine peptidase [Terracoccus sp.]
MTRSSFRPVRSRIIATASVAAACIAVAGAAQAAPEASSLVSDRAAAPVSSLAAGEVMSYVVNSGAGTAKVARAETAVRTAGGVVIQTWPEIGVVVAHSTSATFATDVRLQPTSNVITSAGPTRTAPVPASETPIATTGASPNARALARQTFEQRQGVSTATAAADPLEADQWDMNQIRADIASDGSRRVTVGVLDSGIDDTHPDLAPNIDAKDSVGCATAGVPNRSRAAWIPTTSGHGTHVAGTIAAARNGIGIVGVAAKSRLASVKVVNDDGFIYPEYAICGFMWSAERGIDVTNNSYYIDPWTFWCSSDPTQAAAKEAVTKAVAYSEKKGVVSAAAAGNSDYDLANKTTDNTSPDDSTPVTRPIDNSCLDLPAELPKVVAVAANDRAVAKSSFSNWGYGKIDVTAPGSGVLSTYPGGGYAYLSGTSMASPHVAGVLALLKASHPGASPAALVRMVRNQAIPVPCPANSGGECTGTAQYNSYAGDGLVDAWKATR